MFNLKSDFSFISLNTRGLKDNVKRKAIFLFCKGFKAHCIFLQETHSCDEDVTFWQNQWGEDFFFTWQQLVWGGWQFAFRDFQVK